MGKSDHRKNLRAIVRETGRSVSTISREIQRNGNKRGYRQSQDKAKYEQRRERCQRKNVLEEGWLRETVARLLTEEQWSPEEISSRLAREHGKNLVSSNTIYRALAVRMLEVKGAKKNQYRRYPMQKHLRRNG